MRRSTRTAAVLVVGVLTVSLAACTGSSGDRTTPSSHGPTTSSGSPLARYATLRGQSTVVTLTASFDKQLTALGVAPTAVAPATLTGQRVSFPITSGNATVYAKGAHSPSLSGTVRHGGGLKLTTRGMNVVVQNFTLTLAATPTLAGSVLLNGQSLGGSATTLFELDTIGLKEAKSGSTTTLSGLTVYVASTAAAALNLAFGLSGARALPTTEHAIVVGTATITLEG